MANHKRKKSKRTVKCTLCTTHRWKGNGKDRFPFRDKRAKIDPLTKEQDDDKRKT